MVDIRFYQAAVVVIPTLVVAAALVSSVVGPASQRTGAAQGRPGGWGIAGAVVVACFVIVAELLALGSLAAGEASGWRFVVVLAAITILSAGLGVMAVHRLVEPLRGTWLEGIEWLVIVTTSVFTAAAIAIAFLEG